MSLAEVWSELETGAAASRAGGWIVRRVHPEASFDIRLGLETRSSLRAIFVRVPNSAVSSRIEFPSARGFDCKEFPLDDCPPSQTTIGVLLTEPLFADVFATLAEDVLGQAAGATSDEQVIAALVERLRVWRCFMENAGLDGLSRDAQKGLYGELHFLREFLIPVLGTTAAIQAWSGPTGSAQDFQWNRIACEVKASSSKRHLKVRISNELQLDSTSVDRLWLYFLSLDARSGSGETLLEIVEQIRETLKGSISASVLFSSLLLQAGYHPAHSHLYSKDGYTIREAFFFNVEDGFPRIVEADLLQGIGDVSYSVLLSECMPFRDTASNVLEIIGRR